MNHPASANDVHRPDGRRVTAEIRTTATPEQVWKAWTEPADLSRWFTDRARGRAVPGETITWIFDEFGAEIPYPVVVAEPGERLVLAGDLPDRGPFALEVLIERDGGETVVRLVNSGFLDGAEWDEEFEGVRSGWENALAMLAYYLEHHAGENKRSILVMRPATFAYETLYPYFTESSGLSTWLTTDGAIGPVGAECRLALRNGGDLHGTVLSATGREVAVSWPERDAVLELKAFRAGPGRMVAARITAWGATDDAAAELRTWLTARVEALAARLT